jgi:hypothetical protein
MPARPDGLFQDRIRWWGVRALHLHLDQHGWWALITDEIKDEANEISLSVEAGRVDKLIVSHWE